MALKNVMRVDGGNVIDGVMPQTYPASHVMMSDGETSVEEALDGAAITVTPASGYVCLNTYIRKIGKSVIGCINPRKSSGTMVAGWNNNVGSISGVTISALMIFSVSDSNGDSGLIRINTDGTIDVYIRSTPASAVFSTIYFEV